MGDTQLDETLNVTTLEEITIKDGTLNINHPIANGTKLVINPGCSIAFIAASNITDQLTTYRVTDIGKVTKLDEISKDSEVNAITITDHISCKIDDLAIGTILTIHPGGVLAFIRASNNTDQPITYVIGEDGQLSVEQDQSDNNIVTTDDLVQNLNSMTQEIHATIPSGQEGLPPVDTNS
jgi:hypothetical protein